LLAAVISVAIGAGVVIAVVGGGSKPAASAEVTPPTATAMATATPTSTPTAPTTPITHAGILDGVPMTDAEWAARKDLLPIAVMFDNSPDAYPQAGLDKADLVYEAFVEGGITRFMGVYWRQEADYLEPVRSARTPFVIWADELGALYAHAGQADTDNEANAGGQIQEWKIFDMNAFLGESSNAFYRDSDRYAPHNLVTNTSWLREAASKMGYAGPPAVESWLYKANDEDTSSLPAAGGIEVNFEGTRNPWQLVQWHWDAASHSYLRYEFGGPHLDQKTSKQLAFTNVVVMTAASHVADENGHVLIDNIGSGPVQVFIDGKVIVGTWKKADRKARTRFYDAQGKEIAFDRGATFIEVIGLQSTMTVTATAAELPAIPQYSPPPQIAPVDDGEDDAPPVNTPTPGASPTPTRGGTATPTPGGTSTATPVGTATPGGTPSATATGTASATSTAADTSTPDPTGTSTTGTP
jgi:hypothetical protein